MQFSDCYINSPAKYNYKNYINYILSHPAFSTLVRLAAVQALEVAEKFNQTKLTIKALIPVDGGSLSSGVFHLYHNPAAEEQQLFNSIDGLLRFLHYHLLQKDNIYMVANQLTYKADTNAKTNLSPNRINRLVFDFDGMKTDAEKQQLIDFLTMNDLLPRCYLKSKNGVHLHYLVESGMTVESYAGIHKAMQYLFARYGFTADPVVSNPAGLIRLAGTLHVKNGVTTELEPFIWNDQSFNPGDTDFLSIIDQMGYNWGKKPAKARKEKPVESSFTFNGDFTGCETVYDVVAKKHGRCISAPYIANALNKNGITVSVRSVTRRLAKLAEHGLITRTKVGKFVKDGRNEASTYQINKPKSLSWDEIKTFAGQLEKRIARLADKEFIQQFTVKHFSAYIAKVAETAKVVVEGAVKVVQETTSQIVESVNTVIESAKNTIQTTYHRFADWLLNEQAVSQSVTYQESIPPPLTSLEYAHALSTL